MTPLEDSLFNLEQDLLDAEEEKDWHKVLDVVKKLQALGDQMSVNAPVQSDEEARMQSQSQADLT